MYGDGDSLVVVVDPPHEFGEMGLYFPQRQRCHSQKYDQNDAALQAKRGNRP